MRFRRPATSGGGWSIGPRNFDIAFTDTDGRPKKITLFMSEEHIDILTSTLFRVITGYEKKAGKNIPKIICLGHNHAATLELAA